MRSVPCELKANTVFEIYRHGKEDFNYYTDTGEFVIRLAASVIDPTKVVRFAAQNAASAAGLMITTETMITEKPEKKRARPPPMVDDMH